LSDIVMYAGDTTIADYTVSLNGTPVDLTGLTLKWAARWKPGDSVPVIEKATGSGIVHIDAVNGKARLTLVPADTAALAVSSVAILVWALRLYDASDIYTVATGLLVIEPAAQRQ